MLFFAVVASHPPIFNCWIDFAKFSYYYCWCWACIGGDNSKQVEIVYEPLFNYSTYPNTYCFLFFVVYIHAHRRYNKRVSVLFFFHSNFTTRTFRWICLCTAKKNHFFYVFWTLNWSEFHLQLAHELAKLAALLHRISEMSSGKLAANSVSVEKWQFLCRCASSNPHS